MSAGRTSNSNPARLSKSRRAGDPLASTNRNGVMVFSKEPHHRDTEREKMRPHQPYCFSFVFRFSVSSVSLWLFLGHQSPALLNPVGRAVSAQKPPLPDQPRKHRAKYGFATN